ncbi:DTW domain-containing protein [Radiomyces spectabilis]|uniref:DTW domain-containing protein n=1 Tax=Radiomyces spectabilis TaxID=64574 RepID=UPI00221EE0C1|nr:DTW domain-containing protein [Radiomyces spectabilis]KAI8393472.1 DTW domain-containing protein [Radiomyces spectabilis]
MSDQTIEVGTKRDHPEESPFDHLNISDDSILKSATDRHKCLRCQKTVKYFCYRCFDVVGMDRSSVPFLKLPVHLDVVKHEQELDGKSTAIHARVIANEDVDIYNWQSMPKLENPERTLLLFPGPDAKTLKDIPRDSFDRVIVIDGTWKQANKIARETPGLQSLQKVTISPRETHFWRYQQLSEHHLATIEAIYYFYREYAEAYETTTAYDGRYDNLLFYYRFFYKLIQDHYRTNSSKRFTHRHGKKDYIKYDKPIADSHGKDHETTAGTNNKQEPSPSQPASSSEQNKS